MNLFKDKGLMDELLWFMNCLDEDKISYKASLNIDSTAKKPFATISNGRVTLTIKRVAKSILYTIRDDDAIRHARKEGFTEEEIMAKIKCNYQVDVKLAEIMITKPTYLADSKLEMIKENLAKNDKESY